MQLKGIDAFEILTDIEGKSKHIRNRFVEENIILKTIYRRMIVLVNINPHIEVAKVDITCLVIALRLNEVTDHHIPLLVKESHFFKFYGVCQLVLLKH